MFAEPLSVEPERHEPAPAHLEFHPIAEWFPAMEKDELKALSEDIRENGLRHAIILHEGKILDGRHRFLACELAQSAKRYEHLSPGTDPLEYVLSANLHRRHLSTAQRAVLAERMADARVGHPRRNSTRCSRATAARIVNVSERSVSRARTIRKQCDDDVFKAIRDGKISMRDAEEASAAPRSAQRKALALVNKHQCRTLAEALPKVMPAPPSEPPAPDDTPAATPTPPAPDPTGADATPREPTPHPAPEPPLTLVPSPTDVTHDDPATPHRIRLRGDDDVVIVPSVDHAERVRTVLGSISVDALGNNEANVVVRARRVYPPRSPARYKGTIWLRCRHPEEDIESERLASVIDAHDEQRIRNVLVEVPSGASAHPLVQTLLAMSARIHLHDEDPRLTLLITQEEEMRERFDTAYAGTGITTCHRDHCVAREVTG